MRWLLITVMAILMAGEYGKAGVIAGKAVIEGHAPGYEGTELVFHTYADLITYTEAEFFRAEVDSSGHFSAVTPEVSGPVYIFSNPGAWYLFMYVEPDREYSVVLPEYKSLTGREALNPYHQGIPVHLAVLNHGERELNSLIRNFDEYYDTLFGETFDRISSGDRALLDSVSVGADRRFAGSGHAWFDDYRRYKMAMFRIMVRAETARSISDKYFRNDMVLYRNMPYMELFNQIYNNYFLFFGRTSRGSSIFEDINRYASISRLRNTLQSDNVLGDDRLLELVMLKGLHGSFYGSDFSRSALLRVTDSLAATTVFKEHAEIARNIREKTTRLMTGFSPPPLELKNRNGEMTFLSDYEGEFVYLNFCTAVSYACLSEYDLLQRLDERYGSYFRIVTIFIGESFEDMDSFLQKNDYNWDFLFYGNQPSVLKDYDIRIFPTCYFIDRDGKLLMSPAPLPSENFERYLVRTLRSEGIIK